MSALPAALCDIPQMRVEPRNRPPTRIKPDNWALLSSVFQPPLPDRRMRAQAWALTAVREVVAFVDARATRHLTQVVEGRVEVVVDHARVTACSSYRRDGRCITTLHWGGEEFRVDESEVVFGDEAALRALQMEIEATPQN